MPVRLENDVFVGQEIMIDDKELIGNQFKDCVLSYGGGPFTMKDNVLENVRWRFVDAAARTITFLAALHGTSGDAERQVVEGIIDQIRSTSSAPTENP